MANLSLKHIYKVYPNGTKAVNDFNMEIKDKEFIVFVGPSGCGKSTTLRMIAGLEKITYGELTIDDEVVNSLEPKERDIAMVFQNYALYPHMSIFENIAFGLRTRKIDKKIINQKVNEAANILGISDYLNKKPKEMSGGQRQRVALGRAIVREPKVMLLDEPLSNLDAKLRTQMRSEIVKLHKKLNTTFIYVTHDQVEAMTMGTRIVVMKDGYIKQIDSPKNLYRYPANLFVASFIGSPQMNFFRVLLKKENNDVEIKFLDVETKIIIPFSKLVKIQPTFLTGTKEVILGIRSENISLSKTNNSIKMKVSHFEELGNETLIYGDIDLNNDSIGDSPTKVIIKIPGFMEVEANSIIDISFDFSYLHLFDKESEESILKRIPDNNYVDVCVKKNKIKIYSQQFDLPPAVKIEDGDYEALIPLEAISVTSGDKINVMEKEKINDKYLLTLNIDNNYLFALSKVDYSSVNIDIDISKISIYDGNELILQPVDDNNSFIGEFVNKKVSTKNAKTHNEYYLRFINHEFLVDDSISKKICQAYDDRRVFHEKFSFNFSSNAISLTEDGIAGKVLKVLDYKTKKLVVVGCNGQEIILEDEKHQVDEEVFVSFDFTKMSVIEIKRNIRII